MLEQAQSLRTGGTSLTLFKNGWRVLDAIGVANDLRTQFLEIQGYIHEHDSNPVPLLEKLNSLLMFCLPAELDLVHNISCTGWW